VSEKPPHPHELAKMPADKLDECLDLLTRIEDYFRVGGDTTRTLLCAVKLLGQRTGNLAVMAASSHCCRNMLLFEQTAFLR